VLSFFGQLMRVLVLLTDAFGGHGGIAKFNRDLLYALCSSDTIDEVTALPRLATEPIGTLPPKLNYDLSALGGKIRFAFAALRAAIRGPRPALIICGHINLLPIAFAARFICRARVALVIHGVEAWQPTGSSLSNRFAHKIDAFIAVSEFTRKKFMAWAN